MKYPTWTANTVATLSLSFLLSGCIDGELPWKKKGADPSSAPVEEPVAFVSVYQASPGVSNADLVIDGETVNSSPLNYGQQEKYMRIPSGNKTLTLSLSGHDVAALPIALVKETQYSIFVVGDAEPSFMVMPVTYDNITPGYIRITFLNLSPDAPDVNLVEDVSNTVLFEKMSFKEAPDFVEIPAQSSYDLTIRSAADNSILVQIPAKRLYAGWNYTVMLRGYHAQSADPSVALAAEILSEVQR
ncbi:MAG TPA: DUF4397 domain-containing protein [Cyclobacteriaceae bacterium]|nr:DUF4397 domain-containing protein [Cyclobacteriaceae bacterium]